MLAGWLKGKQVKILCDLVTVIGEQMAWPQLRRHWLLPGRLCHLCRSLSQETCRLLVQEHKVPDHEFLVVPYQALKAPGSVALCSLGKGFFCLLLKACL